MTNEEKQTKQERTEKHGSRKMSAINKTIISTILTVFAVFTLLIAVLIKILFTASINNAKETYAEDAHYITESVKNRIGLMANMLQLTQESLSSLNFHSGKANVSANNILQAMVELSPNVHRAWFGLEKGVYLTDRRYFKSFIRQGDAIIETEDPSVTEKLDDPDISPWYTEPLLSGQVYFDNVDIFDDGTSGQIYVATVSVPIYSLGKIIGVCGVNITYHDMFSLNRLQDTELNRTVLLLNQDLKILHAENRAYIFKKLSDFAFTNSKAMAAAVNQGTEYLEETLSPFSGKKSFVSLYPIFIETGTDRQPLFLYIDTPLDVLYAEAYRIIVFISSACIVCMVLIVSIIFFNTNNLVRPIRKLTRQVQQISAAKTVEDYVSPGSDEYLDKNNEIFVLEHAFMNMIDIQKENLNLVEMRVEERTRQLKLMTEEAEAAKARAEDAAEAKTQFLANMSHEIRTPMNAIMGMSELLLSENLGEHQQQYVQDIHTSAISLLDIINDILDLSKIQSGKLNLVQVNYDFPSLVSNVGSMARFLIKNKNIVYKFVSFNDLPKCIFGDDVRLRQVLLNVLSNAIKFTDEGFVRLTICVNETSIRFDIEDTGIGIRAQDIPSLFDAFTQVDLVKNYKKKGTGLGLSITKALLEMMGGKITVESLYGRGSIFHIMIPKILGDASQIREAEENEKVLEAPDARILVVDDNTVNLNVSRGLLQLCKINADTVTSGAEAIEMVRQKQYDIVFMDHMMPEMDGIEATRIIRGMGIKIPIIALSANAVAGVREKFLAAGMNDFLTKPINRAMLKKILLDWIPAEKIREPDTVTHAVPDTETASEFWNKIERIEEISVHAGLERVSGQRNIYESSLKLMLKEIEKCTNNLNNFLMADDMHNFCVEVHSMKGSLANIGAMELSAKARDLEAASDKGNAAFCSVNLPSFLENLSGLASKLKEVFAGKVRNGGAIEIPPDVVQVFEKLTGAFGETNFLLINEAMENLDALNPENDALKEELETIRDAVMMMDYDGASEVIRKLLSAQRGKASRESSSMVTGPSLV